MSLEQVIGLQFLHHGPHGTGAPDQWTEAGSAEVRIRYHFFFCTQVLLYALCPASAYLDVVAKLKLGGLGQAMSLRQPSSPRQRRRKL